MRQEVVRSVLLSAIAAATLFVRPAAGAQADGGTGQVVNGVTTNDFPTVGALLSPANPNTAPVGPGGHHVFGHQRRHLAVVGIQAKDVVGR